MQLTSFVDESGTGGDPRIMLGGLVARSSRWFAFAADWRRILSSASAPYSHLVDMENGKPPFKDWDVARTAGFVGKAASLILKHCDFGQTVAIDLDVHQTEYRARLSDRIHKDSAYGLCARAMMEGISIIAMQRFGPKIRINFIFEDNEHYGDAYRIFNDCKEHLNNIKSILGSITPGRREEFGGLQAADLIASIGRRQEKKTVFRTVDLTSTERRDFESRCPIWHVPLDEQHMPDYCRQAEEIALEKRGAQRKRRFNVWKGRKYPAS